MAASPSVAPNSSESVLNLDFESVTSSLLLSPLLLEEALAESFANDIVLTCVNVV
jgi:hypothetical protein